MVAINIYIRYPNEFGWQLLNGKMVVKRSPEFKQFHQFLVAETEVVSWICFIVYLSMNSCLYN
jgi:hypothetical protein